MQVTNEEALAVMQEAPPTAVWAKGRTRPCLLPAHQDARPQSLTSLGRNEQSVECAVLSYSSQRKRIYSLLFWEVALIVLGTYG